MGHLVCELRSTQGVIVGFRCALFSTEHDWVPAMSSISGKVKITCTTHEESRKGPQRSGSANLELNLYSSRALLLLQSKRLVVFNGMDQVLVSFPSGKVSLTELNHHCALCLNPRPTTYSAGAFHSACVCVGGGANLYVCIIRQELL